MTPEQLAAAIAANPQALACVEVGDDAGAARIISAALPPVVRSRVVNEASVMRILGAARGDALLTTLEALALSNSIIKRAVRQMQPGGDGIDLGAAETRAQLDALVTAGALDADDVADLKADAEQPQTVTADEVSAAWLPNRPDGRIAGGEG